ncbi:uncharacterized protein BP01DRAFT_366387 [Aspergillus saccharolyticus JOP 1030-1]|uniref:Uncharacterized protein n=1 Tax=Aspergillus saccharolyticus JOP 1030-1 TaxID=1450539 RepID=A0A319ACC0_9EURO|nr:hypothetical protein BP01DRAFT_366387 [Aspergillus saccharolyticus JOP 1030-1]PYH44552.1 hypothetical protein BP01DRAFT_366387 [Aspergillus saccharolyticus JOP 1030-1]
MSTLDIVEVYATYTTQLQLQARNSPTKGLLIHLNLLREELDIVMSTIRKQFELTQSLCKPKASDDKGGWGMEVDIDDTANRMAFEWLYSTTPDDHIVLNMSTRKLLKAMQASLQEKIYVLDELVKRAERLEQHSHQIVQRVDIIQEDHGKATLIFTIVATIFLPLSFVTSYLGMNTADIRNMDANQAIFWEVATPVTVAVVVVVLLVAYNASRIVGLLPQRQV